MPIWRSSRSESRQIDRTDTSRSTRFWSLHIQSGAATERTLTLCVPDARSGLTPLTRGIRICTSKKASLSVIKPITKCELQVCTSEAQRDSGTTSATCGSNLEMACLSPTRLGLAGIGYCGPKSLSLSRRHFQISSNCNSVLNCWLQFVALIELRLLGVFKMASLPFLRRWCRYSREADLPIINYKTKRILKWKKGIARIFEAVIKWHSFLDPITTWGTAKIWIAGLLWSLDTA